MQLNNNLDATSLLPPERFERIQTQSGDDVSRYRFLPLTAASRIAPTGLLVHGVPAPPLGEQLKGQWPERWLSIKEKSFEPFDLQMTVFRNGHIFGGGITERWLRYSEPLQAHFHRGSQTILDSKFDVADSESFCAMDGERSLPLPLFADQEGAAPSDQIRRHCLDKYSHLQHDSDTVLYLGNAHPHFGHFLLETLTRLWCLDYLDSRVRREICIVIPRHPSGLPSWAIELLELFFEKSLTDRILFIDEGQCASFKNILFPSTCFRTHQAVHPITRDLCRKVGQIARNLSSQDPKEAIFLSRAHIGNRKCRNEEAVENAFVAKGYHVVIPEKLTAIDQLALAATSKKIAGFTGSANYLALFSAGLSEFTVCAPRDFFLIDEYMISSLQACELNVVFGTTREGDLHVNNGSWELNLDELKSVS